MTSGEKIKKSRLEKKLSQKALGEKLGMPQQMIAQYESGKRQPKIETLGKIAMVLDIPVSDLLGDLDFTPPVPPGKIRVGSDDDGNGGILVDPIEFQRVFNGVVQKCCPNPVSILLEEFYKLTPAGQTLAIKQTKLLTRIPEYQAPKNPAYPGPKSVYVDDEIEDECDDSKYSDLEPQAAHERTDIEVTEEMRKHDDDIMNDDNF